MTILTSKQRDKNLHWINEVLPSTFKTFVEGEIEEFRRMVDIQLNKSSNSTPKATPSKRMKQLPQQHSTSTVSITPVKENFMSKVETNNNSEATTKLKSNIILDKSYTDPFIQPIVTSNQIKTPKVLPWTSLIEQTPLSKATPKQTPKATPKKIKETPIKDDEKQEAQNNPPSTIKRKRRITQTPNKESPLSRANRIDRQNSWREKQLREFMNTKAQGLLETSKISERKTTTDLLVGEKKTTTDLLVGENLPILTDERKNQQKIYPLDDEDLTFHTASSLSSNIQQPLSDEAYAIELARRRRLRERNEQALERRKEQLLRAQKLKSSVPGLAFLPSQSSVTKQPMPQVTLPKQPMPQVTLPKQQTPLSNKHKYRIPQEEDYFMRKDTPQKFIPAPHVTPPNPAHQSTPPMPQSATSKKLHSSKDSSGIGRPRWADTPLVKSSLQHQHRNLRAEEIFGSIEPVRLEDLFKGKKFERSNRKSSIWLSHQNNNK